MKPAAHYGGNGCAKAARHAVPGEPGDGENPAGSQKFRHPAKRRLDVHVVTRGDRGDQIERSRSKDAARKSPGQDSIRVHPDSPAAASRITSRAALPPVHPCPLNTAAPPRRECARRGLDPIPPPNREDRTMTETVDQAQAQPPRALAGIIEDARRATCGHCWADGPAWAARSAAPALTACTWPASRGPAAGGHDLQHAGDKARLAALSSEEYRSPLAADPMTCVMRASPPG
jgi:hypothetical protein